MMKRKRIEKALTLILKIVAFLFCFLTVKSIFGLFYWRMTHLSAEDLAWVQTIAQKTSHDMFVSESAPPLKLRVNNIYINNDGNPFYISTNSHDVYEANAGYEYVLTGNKREIKGNLRIERKISTDSLTFKIRLHNLSSDDNSDLFGYQPLQARRMELGGRVFDDCICSDSIHWNLRSYPVGKDSLLVDKLIVSKKYGLIYFRYSNGTEYYRDFQ